MSDAAPPRRLWAEFAWIEGGWQRGVLLGSDADGRWDRIEVGVPCPPEARRLPGPVLPGMVDAHSHAFQRAFAGLAERRTGPDDFWTWRDRMYGVAASLDPDGLRHWATLLYRELLAGGYTQVCEFHYLHHAPDGRPYADPLAFSRALVEAAETTGIGLTLLPVLYERAGLAQPTLRSDQRRFATDVAQVLALRDGIRALRRPRVDAGVALHSLRAVTPDAMQRLCAAVAADPAPLHIHVAEQTAEVDEVLAHTGCRPVEWLLRHQALDARWMLVHTTHVTPDEIDGVAASGAGIVLCPGTEANLGDGFTDVPRWLAAGVPLAIGSDSQVTRAVAEELRWLDYGQRLLRRQRNVCADPQVAAGSTAARLFDRALRGGAAAAGFRRWGLQVGARADLVVLDAEDPALHAVPPEACLDAWVFSSPTRPPRAVLVSGRWVHTAADVRAPGRSAADVPCPTGAP